MPTVTLIQGDDGRLVGMTDADQRGWGRFLKRVKSLAGSCITFEWREPRSGPFHRWVFVQLSTIFDSQERFSDFDQFRHWVSCGAGHCDFLPHPQKGLIAIPKSIAYAKLDQAEFEPIANSMFEFLRSEHARQTLWPHLSNEDSFDMICTVMEQFE